VVKEKGRIHLEVPHAKRAVLEPCNEPEGRGESASEAWEERSDRNFTRVSHGLEKKRREEVAPMA